MRNWKTTLAGILVAVATLGGPAFGLPPKVTNVAQGVVIALGLSVAKDFDVSHTQP